MGLYGCVRAWGHGETQKQDKQRQNGLAGYVSVACMAGKFPGKHACMCAQTKRGIRDSGG